MSEDPDLSPHHDYYSARAVEERRLAMSAKDLKVRDVHLEMAERYEQLAATGGHEPPQVIGERQRAG